MVKRALHASLQHQHYVLYHISSETIALFLLLLPELTIGTSILTVDRQSNPWDWSNPKQERNNTEGKASDGRGTKDAQPVRDRARLAGSDFE